MKKLIIILAVIFSFGTSSNAQYIPGDNFLSLGAGIGTFGNYNVAYPSNYSKVSLPTLIGQYEIGFHEYFGIGVYGTLNYQTYKNNSNNDIYDKYSFISFGGCLTLHIMNLLEDKTSMDHIEDIDVYSTFRLGPSFRSHKHKFVAADGTVTTNSSSNTFLSGGFSLGVRYFFDDEIAIYVEMGLSNFALASAGITFKI